MTNKNYLTLSKSTCSEKHSMKKLILFTAALGILLYSCGKNATISPDSYVSATMDGVTKNFSAIDSLGYSNTSTLYSMTVKGKTGTSDTSDVIQLNVFSASPITTGTYTLSPDSHQAPYYPLVVYLPKGSHNLADDYVVDYTGNHPVSITITSLTKTSAQGTFSGTLIIAAGNSGATKTITDGKFYVSVK
jgi:hypothetical protein